MTKSSTLAVHTFGDQVCIKVYLSERLTVVNGSHGSAEPIPESMLISYNTVYQVGDLTM